MLFDELGRLHEHSARTASGIEHLASMRSDNLDHETHNGAGSEELTAFRAFASGEFREKIFVDLTEEVARPT